MAQHFEYINCTSKLSNSETKVTETNSSSNHSRKIPATRSSDFFMGKLNVKNSDVLNSKSLVLQQPLNSTVPIIWLLNQA